MHAKLWGLGYTFTSGAEDAWLTDEVGDERASAGFLRAAQISSLAGILGTLAAIFIGSWRLNAPIILAGVACLGLALLLLRQMPERGFKPLPRENRETWAHLFHIFRSGAGYLRGSRVLLALMLIGLFLGLHSEGYDRLNTPHLLTNFTLPDFGGVQPIAWLNALGMVSGLLNIGATQWLLKRIPPDQPRLMARGLLFISAIWVAAQSYFALSGDLWLAVLSTWVISLMRHLYHPLETIWLNRNISDSGVRATVLSMRGQVDALGQILGGPPIGGIGERYGMRLALLASAGLLAPAVALLGHLARGKAAD